MEQGNLGQEAEPREESGPREDVAVINPRWGEEIFYTRGRPRIKCQNENAQERGWGGMQGSP